MLRSETGQGSDDRFFLSVRICSGQCAVKNAAAGAAPPSQPQLPVSGPQA